MRSSYHMNDNRERRRNTLFAGHYMHSRASSSALVGDFKKYKVRDSRRRQPMSICMKREHRGKVCHKSNVHELHQVR